MPSIIERRKLLCEGIKEANVEISRAVQQAIAAPDHESYQRLMHYAETCRKDLGEKMQELHTINDQLLEARGEGEPFDA